MEITDPCVICGTTAETLNPSFDGIHQKCPRCGEFKITGSTLARLPGLARERRAMISGWLLDQNRAGAIPMLTTENIGAVAARALPSVAERASRLLIEAAHGQESLTQ